MKDQDEVTLKKSASSEKNDLLLAFVEAFYNSKQKTSTSSELEPEEKIAQ